MSLYRKIAKMHEQMLVSLESNPDKVTRDLVDKACISICKAASFATDLERDALQGYLEFWQRWVFANKPYEGDWPYYQLYPQIYRPPLFKTTGWALFGVLAVAMGWVFGFINGWLYAVFFG